jgi:hypothetical protein
VLRAGLNVFAYMDLRKLNRYGCSLSPRLLPNLYDEYPTFHAKYEGALHLMLLKCIAFHLSTDYIYNFMPFISICSLVATCTDGHIYRPQWYGYLRLEVFQSFIIPSI